MAFVAVWTCCSDKPPAIEFWPSDAVRRKATDYQVVAEKQIGALQSADPKKDAERAFARGDYRFLGDPGEMSPKPWLAGIVEPSNRYNKRIEECGFKRIGQSEALLDNEDFQALKHKYEWDYNRRLFELLRTEWARDDNAATFPPAR